MTDRRLTSKKLRKSKPTVSVLSFAHHRWRRVKTADTEFISKMTLRVSYIGVFETHLCWCHTFKKLVYKKLTSSFDASSCKCLYRKLSFLGEIEPSSIRCKKLVGYTKKLAKESIMQLVTRRVSLKNRNAGVSDVRVFTFHKRVSRVIGTCVLPHGDKAVVSAATAPWVRHDTDTSAVQLPHGPGSWSTVRRQSRDRAARRHLQTHQRVRPGDLWLPDPGEIWTPARLHCLFRDVGRLEWTYSSRHFRFFQAGRFQVKS